MLRITQFSSKKQDVKADFTVNPQSGSAIVWIFLMVGLFAALNYAMSQGARTGSDKITKEQARVAASEIMDYARLVKQTVQRLQIDGCSDTQISFDNAASANYNNANAPADNSCHVFHPNGGGINWVDFSDYNDGTELIFHARACVPSVGTGDATDNTTHTCTTTNTTDLLLIIPYLNLNVCLAINEKLSLDEISNEPPQDHSDAWATSNAYEYFQGSYAFGYQITDQSGGQNFDNQMLGCFEGGGSPAADTYHFYQVLIAR